jgi:hypothetical protein
VVPLARTYEPAHDHIHILKGANPRQIATIRRAVRSIFAMSLDALLGGKALVHRPVRMQRGRQVPVGAVYVGFGTKWANPIKRRDVETLISSEADVAAVCKQRGWKAAAVLLYRDYLLEEGLDPTELQGKHLICTCKLSEPCHADALIELANQ